MFASLRFSTVLRSTHVQVHGIIRDAVATCGVDDFFRPENHVKAAAAIASLEPAAKAAKGTGMTTTTTSTEKATKDTELVPMKNPMLASQAPNEPIRSV